MGRPLPGGKAMVELSQAEWMRAFEPDRERRPQQRRKKILQFLERRRLHAGPAVLTSSEGTWGYSALCIPKLDYKVLLLRFPDLKSGDREIRARAWRKLIQSGLPRAMGWLVDDSIGRRKANNGIIVK